jgi:hypothetical protein
MQSRGGSLVVADVVPLSCAVGLSLCGVVFENMVPRKVLGASRKGVTGGWRKLHIGEFCDPYFSPNIIRTMKPRRMRATGYVARVADKNAVCFGGET